MVGSVIEGVGKVEERASKSVWMSICSKLQVCRGQVREVW